ncbi:PH domain-containing protein [Chloropicon primus]|uniref:PDK1-type PH domain-containing protein n=1 Tax=Chloropicon primus TaxID=1764295 RepID=A0A5B8MPE5_9CHLO|nr:hypothetical protein A3770_08p50660 [Chloropicon primus]UPR01769.1 PH domain-containing protein [Chloropicon primus]|eukprot:QDZ22548.1 hypothetical protein A3770_08p50660 [Chloropicon primus]
MGQVSVSALVVLVTAVFFLSRRKTNKRVGAKNGVRGGEQEDPAAERFEEEDDGIDEAEAQDVVSDLDVPPDVRGTFSLVEKTLARQKEEKANKRRDPMSSMITHPENDYSGPSGLRIKTSQQGDKMSSAQKIQMVLEPGETVLKKGTVVKKKFKGLYPKIRVLCLTDSSRLLWLDQHTFEVKSSLEYHPEWTEVSLSGPKKFKVKTIDEKTNWAKETMIYSEKAESWVEEISKTLAPRSPRR